LLGLSNGCGGKLDTNNVASGAAGSTENRGENTQHGLVGAAGAAAVGNAGGARSESATSNGYPAVPGIPPSTSPVDASAGIPVDASPSAEPGPATKQGDRDVGSCAAEPLHPVGCSEVSGPRDAVFKSCISDSDCTLERYQDDCAQPNVLTAYGVAITQVDAFRRCFPLPTCATNPRAPVETRAEDGHNNLDAGARFNVICEHQGGCQGLCVSSIP
jgi:hypothetical protein